jgi:hypothetical protein
MSRSQLESAFKSALDDCQRRILKEAKAADASLASKVKRELSEFESAVLRKIKQFWPDENE